MSRETKPPNHGLAGLHREYKLELGEWNKNPPFAQYSRGQSVGENPCAMPPPAFFDEEGRRR